MKRKHISSWEHHHVWKNLFWLPAPIYYKLLDWFGGNDGWRPLGYRGRDGR